MKTISSFICIFAVSLALISCGKSEDTFDVLGILPLSSEYHTIYADQPSDSITLQTSRAWSAKVSQDWMSVDAGYLNGTVKSGNIYSVSFPVYFTANTTGKPRIGQFQVDSNGKKIGHSFLQTSWLNITIPQASYTYKDGLVDSATFNATVNKTVDSAAIAFTCYHDATLTTDATWLTPSATSFEANEHEVPVDIETNESGKTRVGHLTLKSGGVSSVITITQLASNPSKE